MSSNNNTGNDNNLLSFLKNQSLFNGSPTRKMSSRSRDRKSERNRSPGANQQYSGNVSYTNQVNTNQVNGNYVDNNRVSTNYQAGNSGAVNGGISLNLQGGNQAATQGGNYQTTTTTYNGGNLQGANIGVTGGNIGVSGGNIGVSGGNIGVSGGNFGVSGGNIGVTTGGNFQGGVSTNVNTQKVSSVNTQGMNSNLNIQGGNFQGGNMQSSSFQGGNFQGGIQGGVTTSGGYSTQVQGGNITTTTTSNNFSGDALQNGLLATTVTLATNEKTYASSFESARVETAQRLEGLAMKVKTEINNLNYKLEMFNSQMLSIVTQEYNEIKERIYQVIEESFRNSEGYIQEYMRVQEMKFAEEIIRAKETLQLEMNNIDSMKEDINKPYWRNMAGVFITSEFETKIYDAIRMCENIHTKKFEMDASGYRLRDMERYLVEQARARLEQLRDVEWGR